MPTLVVERKSKQLTYVVKLESPRIKAHGVHISHQFYPNTLGITQKPLIDLYQLIMNCSKIYCNILVVSVQ